MTAKHVYTIAPVHPFADTLAAELLKEHADNPVRLASTVLFLPTRRACKTVQEAFLRQSDGKPLMLPRLIPFSLIEDEETQGRLELLNVADLPEAISPLRRRLLLSKMIQKRSPSPLSAEKALHLADALAAFLDETYIEAMPFERLKNLVPDEFAAHWQETLAFLEIVTAAWPEILKEEGVIDTADRQVRLFKAQAEHWRATPPSFPVIAAGSTGSQPATAELLDAIASMENGKVILPGVDMLLDEESFNACEPSHPQYHLRRLLNKMGLKRADLKEFGTTKTLEPKRLERLRLISEAMRPSATTDKWRTAEKFDEKAVAGITKIDCATVQEEALTIALILRETLETPAKTAALITPDRSLARRVCAEMNRWGITLDDSAGTNLTLTPTGAFLLLTGQAALNNWAPADLLACLKHPLASGGKSFAVFRSIVREAELKLLRGKRPGDGLDGLMYAAKDDAKLSAFFDGLNTAVRAFTDLMRSDTPVDFAVLTEAHLNAAEQLAQSNDRTGAERLWAGAAGEAAAAFFVALKEQSPLIGEILPAEYPALLSALLKGVTVRPKYGMHPRLDILGTMEARLIQPDVLILGGLNEGVWPKIPEADPWLSRPMREQCGLGSPERKIALSAHDFTQAFCAKNLIITRSLKDGGTPSVPSRWLMRLEALLNISGVGFNKGLYADWARQIDTPATLLSFRPPQPTPPVSARPRRLSVTRVETLMRDPYSIYARYILGLEKLEDIDADLNAADYGTIVHAAVEEFCTRHPSTVPDDAEDEILAIGKELFKTMNFSQKSEAFWKARLNAALLCFIDNLRQKGDIARLLCEQKGALRFDTPAGEFTLSCIADRIDMLNDGTARLIDYKTGETPSSKQVNAGYAPQLPLETAIFLNGGFDGLSPKTVAALEYWRLRGADDYGGIKPVKPDGEKTPETLAGEALTTLKAMIADYDNPATPYMATPDTGFSLKYNDYEHLARFDEWATADTSDDDGEEE